MCVVDKNIKNTLPGKMKTFGEGFIGVFFGSFNFGFSFLDNQVFFW
jgi:hypothetical protein